MNVKNQTFDVNNIGEKDIFICAIGYEERSYYLYDKINGRVSDSNKLVINYVDYDMTEKTIAKMAEIKANSSVSICEYEYHDTDSAINHILGFIKERTSDKNVFVHVDYTSMPRSWFCKLVLELQNYENCTSSFWYTEGKYPDDYTQYPGAGIDQFILFSGKPTLRIDKRFHVFGLSYDNLRTQAMISILDPESYIACYASNSNDKSIKNNLKLINEQIIAQSRMSVSLHVEDFESMIYKLKEVVLDFVEVGDIVLVPDGPKPLIMAMSLIPEIVGIPGISCLHVSRNKKFFKPIDVKAIDNVIGFSTTL